MHEDVADLIREFGVQKQWIGIRDFVEFLGAIGIDIGEQALRRLVNRTGLPTEIWSGNKRMHIYTREMMGLYVRMITGVSIDCWLAGRKADKREGVARRMYTPGRFSGVAKRFSPLFAAMAQSDPVQGRNSSEMRVVVSPEGKMLLSRDPSIVEEWDCDWLSKPWHLYRYGSAFGIEPEYFVDRSSGKTARGRQSKWSADSLACFYTVLDSGRYGYCRVPGTMLDYGPSASEVPAVFPAASSRASDVSKHVIENSGRVWLWVWSRALELKPVSLDPMPTCVNKHWRKYQPPPERTTIIEAGAGEGSQMELDAIDDMEEES